MQLAHALDAEQQPNSGQRKYRRLIESLVRQCILVLAFKGCAFSSVCRRDGFSRREQPRLRNNPVPVKISIGTSRGSRANSAPAGEINHRTQGAFHRRAFASLCQAGREQRLPLIIR
jgi:hypothetical protein